MSIFPVRERWASKVRVAPGAKGRVSKLLAPGLTEEQARSRDKLLNRIANQLVKLGQEALLDKTIDELAAASEEELPRLVSYVERRFFSGSRRPVDTILTYQKFAERWTSGELARQHPGRVKPKDHEDDIQRLRDYVYPVIGEIPIADIELEDLEEVLQRLPSDLGEATRRHIAQVASRVLRLAAMPFLRVIKVCPVPEGFLPTVSPVHFPYIRPKEDALLLACQEVDFYRRAFYGTCHREGFRSGELGGLLWTDLDPDVGLVTVSRHKTSRFRGPKSWVLRADTRALFEHIQDLRPRSKGPFEGMVLDHLAGQLRADLLTAGVRREALHTRDKAARISWVTEHCLRHGFVTVHVALGEPIERVTDRTGHTTRRQLETYRHDARIAEELNLGPYLPMDEILPELVRAKTKKSNVRSPSGALQRPASVDREEPPACLRTPETTPEMRMLEMGSAKENFPVECRRSGSNRHDLWSADFESVAEFPPSQKPAENPPFDPPRTPPKTPRRQGVDRHLVPFEISGRVENDCDPAPSGPLDRLPSYPASCTTRRAA